MRHLRLKALGTVGALTLGSCLVYGQDDLPGADLGNGGRNSGGNGGSTSGSGKGGTGFGGMAAHGGAAGIGPAGAGPGGAGGEGNSGADAGQGGQGEEGGGSFGGSVGGGRAGAPSSGGTGGSPSGGSSGGPSAGGSGTGGAITNPELIDNMEDGNQFIEYNEKRSGLWYTAADTAKGASANPPADAFAMAELPAETGTAPGSAWAFHFIGVGGKSDAWGALASIDLINPVGTMKTPYDASKYKGLHFWAKAVTSAATIRVRLVLKGTLAEAGGACGTGCNNHPYLTQALTTQWKEYTLRWDQPEPEQIPFRQEPWGTQVEFNPAELVEIQFVVPPASKTANFWIDDISFVP